MITLNEAKALQTGQAIYVRCYNNIYRRWVVRRMRVTSVKSWKREVERVRVGLKFGLYSAGYLTALDLEDAWLQDPRLDAASVAANEEAMDAAEARAGKNAQPLG